LWATALPPSEDWNVSVAVTETPRPLLSAFSSDFAAALPGLTVMWKAPATTTSVLPAPNTIRAARQRPPSST